MFRFPTSSRQQLFLLSLTEKSSNSIWTLSGHNQMRSAKLSSRLRRFGSFASRDAYIWDLHALAKQIGSKLTASNSGRNPVPADLIGYRIIGKTSEFWHQVWVDDFSDDAGSLVIQSLPTINTVSSFTHPIADHNVYTSSFTLSPLITSLITAENEDGDQELIMESETLAAETALWEATVFPAMPILTASTTPHHKHFGPSFVESISFSVSGAGKLSPVSVKVSLTGGKSMVSPVMDWVEPDSKEVDVTIPGQTEGEDNGEVTITVYPHYRKANLMDCEVASGLYTTAKELHDSQAEHHLLKRDYRIVEMRLEMSQQVSFATPQPRPGLTDSHGPRFASFPAREVSGSVVYYSMEKELNIPTSSELTMHFGGPFFFPMPNVDWQKPTIREVGGQGFLHTYGFIARAAPDAIALGFIDEATDLPVSEFDVATIESQSDEDEE